MISVFEDSAGLNLVVNLLLLSLVVIHLALAFWTWSDARRRIEDPMLVGCSVVAALIFPLVGALVYAIIRPPEFLEDVREREMELQASEARLHQLSYLACPHCSYEVKEEWLRCPSCTRKLREPCATCSKPLDPEWRVCPFCEASVDGGTAARRRRRRPATETESDASSELPKLEKTETMTSKSDAKAKTDRSSSGRSPSGRSSAGRSFTERSSTE